MLFFKWLGVISCPRAKITKYPNYDALRGQKLTPVMEFFGQLINSSDLITISHLCCIEQVRFFPDSVDDITNSVGVAQFIDALFPF